MRLTDIIEEEAEMDPDWMELSEIDTKQSWFTVQWECLNVGAEVP